MDTNHEQDKELEVEPQDANGTKFKSISFHDPNETCNLCKRFLAAPCNNCALCKYFLVKSPSVLKDPSLFEGLYSMLKDTEHNNCNGFSISFLESESVIKISCSVFPRYVKHEVHSLVLSTTYIIEQSWCNACQNDFKGYGFRCKFCDFTIDTYCSLLPGSVGHRYDKDYPFKLTYYSIEGVEEYICEICEEDITTMWFHHCEDCDHSIHPRCIWKIHIKFGPFLSKGSSHENEFPLVESSKIHPIGCYLCGQKETSGSSHFLDCGKIDILNYGKNMFLHLQCYPDHELERWPTEQKEQYVQDVQD